MKHARSDYDRIQDPTGKIPENEPVFLLRGQDMCAPLAVLAWAAFVEQRGGSPEIIKAAKDQVEAMYRWQASRVGRVKIPDMTLPDPPETS